MRHVIGIDAGATKILFSVADQNANVFYQIQTGPGNMTAGGDQAIRNLDVGLEQLRETYSPADCAGVCIGAAGAGDHVVESRLREALASAGYRNAQVTTDAHIALRGALRGEDGVIAIAGTGSIAYGSLGDQTARCGGWGHILNDGGSGYWIGLEMIKQVFQSYDGMEPDTLMTPMLLERLGLQEPRQLIPYVYLQNTGKSEIAALSPLVEDACAQGDFLARRILEEGAQILASYAHTVAKKLNFPGAVKVACYGGVFEKGKIPRELFFTRLEQLGYTPTLPLESAAYGAVLEACRMAK